MTPVPVAVMNRFGPRVIELQASWTAGTESVLLASTRWSGGVGVAVGGTSVAVGVRVGGTSVAVGVGVALGIGVGVSVGVAVGGSLVAVGVALGI